MLIGAGCDRPRALRGRRRAPAATRARAQQATPPGWGRGLFVLFGGARARRWCGPSSGPRALYGLQQHGSTTVRVTPKEPRGGAVAALVCSAPVRLHLRCSWCGRVRGTRRGCQRRTVRLPGSRCLPPASHMRALGCRCRLRARLVFAPAAAVGRGARRTNPPEPGPVLPDAGRCGRGDRAALLGNFHCVRPGSPSIRPLSRRVRPGKSAVRFLSPSASAGSRVYDHPL